MYCGPDVGDYEPYTNIQEGKENKKQKTCVAEMRSMRAGVGIRQIGVQRERE